MPGRKSAEWLPCSTSKTTSISEPMTTITLTLTPYQQDRLVHALAAEVRKWDNVGLDIMLEGRDASLEGARALRDDAAEVLEVVKSQLEAS
jgi:hypothetical protein